MTHPRSQLTQLRKQIDRIDREMLRLLKQRITAARKIGKIKHILGLPMQDGQREDQVLHWCTRQARIKGLDPTLVRSIFMSIMTMAKKGQGKIK